MQLSVVIPFRNEEDNLSATVEDINHALTAQKILFEIIVVNDFSIDKSYAVAQQLQEKFPQVRTDNNTGKPGFGSAVALGLKTAMGKYIVIVMGDGAEYADDIVRYCTVITEYNLDMVLGSRFASGAPISNYPFFKLFFNRLGNYYFSYRSGIRYNDFTNAFKIYSRELIQKLLPLQSNDFSITIEICCKALRSGASYKIIPVGWKGREKGYSKFNLYQNSVNYIRTFIQYY